jgi:hypothetical protein
MVMNGKPSRMLSSLVIGLFGVGFLVTSLGPRHRKEKFEPRFLYYITVEVQKNLDGVVNFGTGAYFIFENSERTYFG